MVTLIYHTGPMLTNRQFSNWVSLRQRLVKLDRIFRQQYVPLPEFEIEYQFNRPTMSFEEIDEATGEVTSGYTADTEEF